MAQETADDVSLIWLADQTQAKKAVTVLENDQKALLNQARIEKIYAGDKLEDTFGDPAAGRTPDIIIQPLHGTIYSKSRGEGRRARRFHETTTLTSCWSSPNPKLESTIVHEHVAEQAGRADYPEGARPGAGRARGGARRRPYPPAAGPAAKGLILRD